MLAQSSEFVVVSARRTHNVPAHDSTGEIGGWLALLDWTRRVRERIRHVARLIVSLMRELSDESAYQRYLETNHVAHSREQWRHFSDHRFAQRFGTPRCC